MNESLFNYWAKKYSGINDDPDLLQEIKRRVVDDADLDFAIKTKLDVDRFSSYLARPSNKSSEAASKQEGKKPGLGLKIKDGAANLVAKVLSDKKLTIAVAAGLFVVILIILGFVFLPAFFGGNKPQQEEGIVFEVPQEEATYSETYSEEGGVVAADEVFTDGLTVAAVAEVEKPPKEKKVFTMTPPSSLPELFSKPNMNFVIFVITLFVMIMLVKKERFAEQEKTDWKVVKLGYLVLILGVLFSSLFALFFSQLFSFCLGKEIAVSPFIIQIVSVVGALVFFASAAITGKTDWTPVSVGLFVIGGMFLIFTPVLYLGYISIVIGIVVHLFELGSQQGTAGAVGLALLGMILFVAARYGLYALLGLIGNASLPADGIVRWIALVAFEQRLIWSSLLSLVLSYSLAGSLASLIFPPLAKILPEGGEAIGNLVSVEDTPRTDAQVLFLMFVMSFWLVSGGF